MEFIDDLCKKNMEIDNYIKNYIIEQLENYYYFIKTNMIYI